MQASSSSLWLPSGSGLWSAKRSKRGLSTKKANRSKQVETSKVATRDVAHVSRRAVAPFVATCLNGMAAGPSCRQSASRGERQEYLKSARKPVALLGNLTRSRRRLQPESLKTKTLSVDTMTRRRKWPISCHSLPYSAILCHFRTFCKANLYLTRQPLCFNHFARPWPLTSRRAGFLRGTAGRRANAARLEPCTTAPDGGPAMIGQQENNSC